MLIKCCDCGTPVRGQTQNDGTIQPHSGRDCPGCGCAEFQVVTAESLGLSSTPN